MNDEEMRRLRALDRPTTEQLREWLKDVPKSKLTPEELKRREAYKKAAHKRFREIEKRRQKKKKKKKKKREREREEEEEEEKKKKKKKKNDDPKSIIFIEYLFPIPPSQSQSQTLIIEAITKPKEDFHDRPSQPYSCLNRPGFRAPVGRRGEHALGSRQFLFQWLNRGFPVGPSPLKVGGDQRLPLASGGDL
ncbi:hypothetical protein ACW185_04370 [Limosilactobacillus fermentum]